MLNSETKRRIDSARDILVGQLPLPTDQVELITIALIYKFMDDIDEQSRGLGGKPTFFVGDVKLNGRTVKLADLNWRALVSNTLDAETRVAKFAQGIEALSTAKQIPDLFKSIFKNTFLKFRDGRILKLFLDEINGFAYDHSEELGNAFEYLLSAMGSQGENGQFRTPRHIIDFIVDVVDPQKDDTILDPACGTGGFLISAYKHILEANTSPVLPGEVAQISKSAVSPISNRQGLGKSSALKSFEAPQAGSTAIQQTASLRYGDLLSPSDRVAVTKNLVGYDITPLMTRLSRVNMYLHHFPNPIIHEYDTLTNDTRWDEKFDCILANPPFMTPKGGVSPHNKFRIPANRAEVLFSDYIVEHLTPDGKAGFIVPEGIIFQSQNAYKQLRRMLVEEYLWAVVSLPAGVFNPYSGVKTSILLLDRTIARREKEVLFVKVENDGYDLGAQRRPIEPNDLPAALKVLTTWKEKRKLVATKSAHVVSREKILSSTDINLSGERYRAVAARGNGALPRVKLSDICVEIKSGFASGKSDENGNGVPHLRPMNISTNGELVWEGTKFISEEIFAENREYALKSGDVLFNNTNSKELVGKTCYIPNDILGGFSNHMTRLRVKRDQLHPKLLAQLLHHMWRQGTFQNLCNKWVGQAGINNTLLSSVEIPMPPLEEQERLVAELEGYRQIIESARQILTHYKPTLRLNPDWPTARLEELCEIKRGRFGHRPRTLPEFFGGPYPFIQTGDVVKANGGPVSHSQTLSERGLSVSKLFQPPVVLVTIAANIGDTALLTYPACFPDSVVALTPNERIDVRFLEFAMRSKKAELDALAPQMAQKNINVAILSEVEIPVPPLAEQRRIVAELEAERALVEANRELAARFEQKLQSRLAEIWGEKPADSARAKGAPPCQPGATPQETVAVTK